MKSFSQKLIGWYQSNARSLPWRETRDPYKIWISEIMLQQTTVNAVIPYYKKWIKKYPTAKKVATACEQEILSVWQGLGYYSRAKNIRKSAAIIVEEFSGAVPDNRENLKKLPGFGPYTIGAVLSIAYDKREPIIDANVRRVIMRILGVEGFADTKQDHLIYAFLDKVMPQKNLRDFNQALMELGALICKSKEPNCVSCPLKSECKAFAKGIQEIIPTPKKKIIKEIDVAIAVIQKEKKYFIQKRSSKGLLADLWEFPGGKIETGETPLKALKREVHEEIDATVRKASHLLNTRHYYTTFKVNLHVYLCELENYPESSENRRWVGLRDFDQFPMPSGSAKIVEKLKGQKAARA